MPAQKGFGVPSSKEVPNQIINGSVMSERDCFLHAIEHCGQMRAAINGLAHLRKDMRYLAVCGILDEIKQNLELLYTKPAGLIIPRNVRN